MIDLAGEWVMYAEDDWRVAQREANAEDGSPSAVVFHLQQCIEKLLKANLVKAGIKPPKVHDLGYLAGLVANRVPSREWGESLEFLSQGAVQVRYPGNRTDRDDAEEALARATPIRAALLRALERP